MTNAWGDNYDVDATELPDYLTSEYDEFAGYDQLDNEIAGIEAQVQEQLMGYIRRGW